MYNSIPVEVWRQIFAAAVRRCVHAQRFQATADDDDHDPFNLASPHLLHGTLKTKLALCLVSKGFNSIATEFLYESVHFTSYERLNSAIWHSPRGGTNKFWWTKVLFVRFWYVVDSSVGSVAHLLSKCVNLRLLYFAARTMDPRAGLGQVKSVYRSLPRGVQAIRWEMDDQFIFQNIPTTVLDNICQMSIESRTIMSTPALTFPRLTYFRARDNFTPTSLAFPALKTVCLMAWERDRDLESSPLGLFIQSVAKQITTLQIESREFFTAVLPVPLINCCTNLTTLKYDPFTVVVRMPSLPDDPDIVQHTKLTHVYNFISVTPVNRNFRLPRWKANYQWLSHGGFPALKHIIMLRSCVSDLVEEQTLSQIASAWTDPRMEFECGVSACT